MPPVLNAGERRGGTEEILPAARRANQKFPFCLFFCIPTLAQTDPGRAGGGGRLNFHRWRVQIALRIYPGEHLVLCAS
jgi:hypothetical protein